MKKGELTIFLCLECVRMCLFKWSLLMNFLLHSGHWKRFSPVCVRRCRCSSSERVNRLPQCTHAQTNGRSPINKSILLKIEQKYSTKTTYRCAIASGHEDVMFSHRLYCIQEYGKYVDAYDRPVVHLRCNSDMYRPRALNVASPHRPGSRSSWWSLLWWSSVWAVEPFLPS